MAGEQVKKNPGLEAEVAPSPEIAEAAKPRFPVTEAIGRGTATDRQANTSETFCFWLRPGYQLNPFDIVAARHLQDSNTYGLVTNISHTTDAATHLSNFIANDFGALPARVNDFETGAHGI